ncbi:hypothetical protein ECB98_04410 [Brucellaceae bacterium VT-16-1752]|nr:hypothetical protein ECB98_04410 [Brucellaceae bacterium VT-16-1752]
MIQAARLASPRLPSEHGELLLCRQSFSMPLRTRQFIRANAGESHGRPGCGGDLQGKLPDSTLRLEALPSGEPAKPLSVPDEKGLIDHSHHEFPFPTDRATPNANSIEQV